MRERRYLKYDDKFQKTFDVIVSAVGIGALIYGFIIPAECDEACKERLIEVESKFCSKDKEKP